MLDKKKCVVLLSGGLDSTTVLAIASKKYDCQCLSFDYGQKQKSELIAAKKIAKKFDASHKILTIDLGSFGGSALTDKNIAVPKFANTNEIPITYVPARNTIFLSFALAFAEINNVDDIFIGVNSTDYSGYPDCRQEYISSFETMANLATKQAIMGKKLTIHTPLIQMNKSQIIKKGIKLGVDYSQTVTCYNANDDGEACGSCDACHYRKLGFEKLGVADNTKYMFNKEQYK